MQHVSNFRFTLVLQVFGQRGMLNCNNERPVCGVESHIGLRGRLEQPIYFSFPSRYHLAYINEMEHFLDVIQGEKHLQQFPTFSDSCPH
jgi:myo-inositol 2-dehydrogenase/D-chiro-inositol 1-dehydrogenase